VRHVAPGKQQQQMDHLLLASHCCLCFISVAAVAGGQAGMVLSHNCYCCLYIAVAAAGRQDAVFSIRLYGLSHHGSCVS
jgi:hypothetical protein